MIKILDSRWSRPISCKPLDFLSYSIQEFFFETLSLSFEDNSPTFLNYTVARFLVLVTTMVTKVDHGN